MLTRRLTIAFLAVAVAALIGWDVYVASNTIRGDTISEIVLGWSKRVWTLPLGVGVACGHLFIPTKRPLPVWANVAILTGVGAVSIILDVVGHTTSITPAIPFVIGIAIGHLGWGQRSG